MRAVGDVGPRLAVKGVPFAQQLPAVVVGGLRPSPVEVPAAGEVDLGVIAALAVGIKRVAEGVEAAELGGAGGARIRGRAGAVKAGYRNTPLIIKPSMRP